MAKLEIPVKVYFGEIDEIIRELKQLQTYKLFEGAEEVLVDINDVARVLAKHVKVTTAEPWQRWILCSERLPEESDYVGCSECIDGAVWYYTDKGAMGLGYYYESTKSWATTDDTAPYGNVVAWRKLPKPYAERRHDG